MLKTDTGGRQMHKDRAGKGNQLGNYKYYKQPRNLGMNVLILTADMSE